MKTGYPSVCRPVRCFTVIAIAPPVARARVDRFEMLDATFTMLQFKDSHGSYLRKHSLEGDQFGPFGLEYTFTLRETELNKNAVDEVPEWMLPLDALEVGGCLL